MLTEKAGVLWYLNKTEDKNTLPNINGMSIEIERDVTNASKITSTPTEEIKKRYAQGNTLYIAKLNGGIAGFGWASKKLAEFGEPKRVVTVEDNEAYLWNFVTYPAFRGKGIYPRLIQHIVDDMGTKKRFWILNQINNTSSAKGIEKAGFKKAGIVYFDEKRNLVLQGLPDTEVSQAGAKLLGISITK